MAAYSSILACEIPWTEEPGGLQSMGPQEQDTIDWLRLIVALIVGTCCKNEGTEFNRGQVFKRTDYNLTV